MKESHEGASGTWSDLRQDFGRDRVISTVAGGVVLGAVNALLGIALMSLIFQGRLTESLPLGIGLGLGASLAIALVAALGSGIGGMFAGVQDASAAILGLAVLSVVAADGGATFDTVVAMMVVTSLATGVVLWLMGRFRLGEISRYLPIPVVGGLLAGTGYLIVAGAVELLGGFESAAIVGVAAVGLFWPGVVLAVLFLIASRRGWPSSRYLWFLLLGTGGFHLLLEIVGVDRATAASRGWLLGSSPEGSLWPGLPVNFLLDADWSAVASQIPAMTTILIIIPMTVVLYVSALEVEFHRDLDVGKELRVMGWANIAAGAVGGPPGYVYLADTVVARRLLGARRGTALLAALTIGLILVGGGSTLGLLPRFVVGGLLLFVGVEFLIEWLWDSRRRMAVGDYFLMVGIVALVATLGFLAGVAAGLVAAIVLFVVRYSRVDVVKHFLDASEHHSNIERSRSATEFLQESGGSVAIILLQGFIFFGTSNRIAAGVRERLATGDPLRFVVIDFRLVSGIDSSALLLFERICLLAEEHGFVLVLTGLDATQSVQFAELQSQFEEQLRVEPDLDRGVAWCEEQLIAAAPEVQGKRRPLPDDLGSRLGSYLDSRRLAAGTRMMEQGDPAPGLFLLVEGRATVLLEEPGGKQVRLRTLLEGTLIGEISLYHDEPVTATVIADTDCEILHLTVDSFDRMCSADPRLAADLHAFVAATLASRVSHANKTIRALYR